ncbi:hypothetical protein O181_088349 [Austropuccinia psidii MF-1]|uniref:Uncharacterized protein n=1 Tax=Austropuccinia psidii MF-1 TaxID=1389203 RepID=A0A9Q3IRI9_9BASI|nr:hypothetical protein [Austropuccinia psidii MF-1]
MLPIRLILTLPYYIHSVRWLVGIHNERNCRNMLSGLLCQQDRRENCGSEISDMASSRELGIEVESQSHEDNQDLPVLQKSQPPSSQKPNFKRYEKEKTVEPCAPTEDAGKDDVIFSGEVEIISKKQFVPNIARKNSK